MPRHASSVEVRWPPLFFSETDFIYNYLHIVQKWTKNQRGKLKKISRFLSTGHGILPSCGCKARETMVSKWERILWGTSPVDLIRFIGPLEPYLAETFPFKALIAIFWDLQPLWPSSLTKPDLLRFRCSSGHILSETKSVTPQFFYIFDITNSSSFNGKILRKKSMLENFRANVLKWVKCCKLSREHVFKIPVANIYPDFQRWF